MSVMKKFSFRFRQPKFDDRGDSLVKDYVAGNIILCIFSIVICIFGLVGNGLFLWLLIFNIKRNVFTTYLLNFSLASFGFLLAALVIHADLFLNYINVPINIRYVRDLVILLLLMTWNNSQFILAIISIDRCVSVLYPSWYLRHKLSNFPTFVCFLIWSLSFLMSGILFSISNQRPHPYVFILTCWLLGPFSLCFLVVTVSTLTLSFKVCFKTQQQQHGALTTAILLTLLLVLLLDAFVISMGFFEELFILPGCSLESSLNPLIYFLVGRWKGSQVKASMRVVLQRVFKEEEPPLANHTQLQSLP